MRKAVRTTILLAVMGLILVLCIFFPIHTFAGEIQDLKQQLKSLTEQLQAVQEKLKAIEEKNVKKDAEFEEMDERLSKAELHTATDKISFGVELRTRTDTIHYTDIRVAPEALVNTFFDNYPVGFNGATLEEAQGMMQTMKGLGLVPPVEEYNAEKDIVLTNKFHLNMKARVNANLDFMGRLSAYKAWGDSTGVQFYNGSLGDITFDGNTSSLPHGDTIRLERAFFNYRNEVGSVPINFSLGRRPSTEGPPLEYGMYSLERGSPLATIVNWQVDGASLNFGLEDAIGIPGAAFKLCYGQGFESDWGNSYSLNSKPEVDDVHMLGFITTLFDNDLTSALLYYVHAWDVTDGFTGLTVMPFTVSKNDQDATYDFARNTGRFITRMEPYTNIGDWDAASLLLRSNLSELFADIDAFLAVSWSYTHPSQISDNPYYEIMGQGLLSSNGELQSHNGYSIYAGALFPMPLDGRLGLEYNWGSKYWFNFTGAEDSLVGSKLATRGHVFETYYIQPIFHENFFIKLGGQYYDYEYTGSGNPLGAPVDIDEATAFDALNAVIDKVWDGYLSVTFRY